MRRLLIAVLLGGAAVAATKTTTCVGQTPQGKCIQDPAAVCWESACNVSSAQPTQWLDHANSAFLKTIYVTGDAESTIVNWGASSPTLRGISLRGTGQTIRGVCPVVTLKDDASVRGITIECTNKAPNYKGAIAVDGQNIEIDDVYAKNGPVFDAVSTSALKKVGSLTATNIESSEPTVGLLANCQGLVQIQCTKPQYVIVQPLSGFAMSPSESPETTGCIVVNIGSLLGYFGVAYEVDYNTKYGGDDGTTAFYTEIIGIEIATLLIGTAALLIVHQDVPFITREKRSLQQ